MNNKDTSYRIPEGFHPFTCADTIRGLTDAIHHYMFEGAGTKRTPSRADQGGLVALIDLLQQHVHPLHAWLLEIENSTSFELPLTEADFEALHMKCAGKDNVREEPAIYAVNQI